MSQYEKIRGQVAKKYNNQISELQQEIKRLNSQLESMRDIEKENEQLKDHNNRLLEFMDMTEEELKDNIEYQDSKKRAMQSLGMLGDMVNMFKMF